MTQTASPTAKAPATAKNGAGEGTALVTLNNAEIYRASTDAAGLSREIVLSTAMEIQQRRYVKVEGWQAIAIAHGCTASARAVEKVDGGVRAIGEVRRMSDGHVIAEAEGFVGEDEPTWYGGTIRAWKWGQERGQKIWYDKTLEKRPDYAIRAMAQTRAISRACRSAFAHVVVMIDANLSTTPAEEVPHEGFGGGEVIDADFTPVDDAPAKAPTLADRADVVMGALRKAKSHAEIDRIMAKGAALFAELDTANPDKLAEIEALSKEREKALEIPVTDGSDAFPGDNPFAEAA